MDIKAKVEEILEKVKGDEGFLAKFKEDPVKAIEDLIGKDLPDEQINAIVSGVKAKLGLDDAMEIAGKLMGLFGKK